MDDKPDPWEPQSGLGSILGNPHRGPPGRRWQADASDRYFGAFLVDGFTQMAGSATRTIKAWGEETLQKRAIVMAETRRRRLQISPVLEPEELKPPPDAPEAVIAVPAAVEIASEPIPRTVPPPALPSARAAHNSPVTEAALASIIEVRRPIGPEFLAGGFINIIPRLVITLLVIVLGIGAVEYGGRLLFGPFWGPFGPRSYVVNPAPQTPYTAPTYPFQPLQRRQ